MSRAPRSICWVLGLVAALAASACGGTAADVGGDGPADVGADAPADELTEPSDAPATPNEDAAEPPEDDGEETEADLEPADAEPAPPAAEPLLEDGRHAALVLDLDASGRSITVDVIQFLLGEEAISAYREDHPLDADGVPENDYYVRNVNPQLRTLPISSEVEVTVVRLGEPSGAGSVPWTLAELPRHLDETRAGGASEPSGPYWLTVEDGIVVRIDEQYVP